ncbi:MAG: secretin N-terminal domain-containing protein [Planctomycetota bacterium]|jgi:general secretion pathway protein D
MSEKIIKKLIISVMLVLTLSCLAWAQKQENVDFDPFAAEANSSASNKYTSGPVIPQVEFNNNDISMAFQIISDATGWSIFPTSDVSRAKINLWAKNISAQQFLDTVITTAGFVYHRDGDVITVMTYDEYMQHHGLAKQTFKLKFAAAASVDAAIKPFLTKLGKSVVHNQTNTIVLYEAQANLKFIESVIEKLDSPSENVIIEVINLKYADSEIISKILQSIFTSQQKEIRNKSTAEKAKTEKADETAVDLPGNSMEIHSNATANQLVVIGTVTDIEKVKNLVAMIDVYSDNMVLEVIDLKYADSELLAEKLQQLFTDEKRSEQAAATPESRDSKITSPVRPVIAEGILSPQSQVFIEALGRTNQLIIKAYRADIERLKHLVDKLDNFVEPVTQNYQLTYIDASEIFTGLENILNLDITNTRSRESRDKNQGLTLISKTNSILLTGPPSAHRIMASIVENIDKPSTYETGMIRIYKLENADVEEVAKTVSELLEADSEEKESTSKVDFLQKNSSSSPDAQSNSFAQSEEFVPQIEARVSVSKSTNSIVVQATARQHRELEKLIKELDSRRRQVLIEAMIVEVTTTDNLNVGVELSHASLDAIAFSAFGLSTNLDPVTGTRDITVSPGGTAAVLRPDKVQAILQLLKQDGNARITSAPRILVNDNAVGFINSIAEEPTTQTNQGETTTTTSFAGFVEAGTQFAITPHISENDYLRVEYQITLNSFGTKPTDPSIPPPRNTSSIQSEATVPNGFSIVVGGLQTTDESENIDKVPILGDIPILEWAFKNTRIEKQYKTTYLFITPHIMENEDFSDLKRVSDNALNEIEANKSNNKQEDIADVNTPQ